MATRQVRERQDVGRACTRRLVGTVDIDGKRGGLENYQSRRMWRDGAARRRAGVHTIVRRLRERRVLVRAVEGSEECRRGASTSTTTLEGRVAR